jgi:mannose-6-phosphate isomerase-like protein (cupin superfamily)
MRHLKTGGKRGMFHVLTSTRDAQAAMMTLRPGRSTADAPENEHPRCEQWLFVVSGIGRAVVGRRRLTIETNSLLLIEKGELHQITCTGRKALITINVYVPPAYTSGGEPRGDAKSK